MLDDTRNILVICKEHSQEPVLASSSAVYEESLSSVKLSSRMNQFIDHHHVFFDIISTFHIYKIEC